MRKNIITITLLFVSAVLTIAQDMNIDVSLRRPVPIALAVWRLDPSVVTIRLTAQRDINNFVLAFEVRNNTTGQSARTRNEHPCMPVFSMRRGETRIINGPALICNNAIDASDELQRSIANAGAIPEGDYSFCVRVLESDRRTQLTTTGRDCDYFNVVWFEQPQLIRPIDPTIAENCQNAIIFNWVGVTPVPIGIVPQYRLRIVGVVEGQEPRVALEAGTPSEVVFDQVIPTTSYTLPPNYPQLVDLANRASPRITRFAWQVQALDDRRVFIPTRGNTQGKSDIGVFTANCTRPSSADCMSPMTLSAFFPSANDTIPWMPPHLIVQWGPYCPQVKEFNYTLDVTEVGAGALPSNSRTLNWRSGIIEAQGLRGQPNAEERARLLITNWRNDAGGVASMNSQWRRGSSYEWRVSASITREESGSDRIRSVSTPTNRFAFGLRMPNNPEPS
ncbi:MAG: hypothetical protein JNL32_01670, partial [Candidatus Kapabacteria bacterium]|nr:hypothetical protein [Candidatus Kapabacteria bacterium]